MFGINVAMLASWGFRLAIAAPILAVLAVVLFRLRILGLGLPLAAVALATLLALIAVLLNAGVLIGGLGGDGGHIQKAVIGLVLALVVAFVPLNTLRKGGDVPPIHDITTDLDNPPVFKTMPDLRTASDNTLALNPETQTAQKTFYTDLAPAQLAQPMDEAFGAVVAAAQAMGWEIVAQDAASGHIEATATTALFGFKDDVVVRLTPVAGGADGGGTRVDVRSASRVGRSDLGANAARIKAFLARLN